PAEDHHLALADRHPCGCRLRHAHHAVTAGFLSRSTNLRVQHGAIQMRSRKVLSVVDCHAEGESGKVIIGGVGQVPGKSMFDKRLYLETYMDDIRKMVLFEPRGAVWHNANIILPSNHPDADMGYVILETTEYPAMSGSNTMCVATILLETGTLPMKEPVTELTLESPAGLIKVRSKCSPWEGDERQAGKSAGILLPD
ncbi:proline racemase family protein, partial [Geminicoccaceae bacterium SYSU G07066]